MITPLELEKNDFKGSPLGYSKKSVDDFVNKIKGDYEKLDGFGLLVILIADGFHTARHIQHLGVHGQNFPFVCKDLVFHGADLFLGGNFVFVSFQIPNDQGYAYDNDCGNENAGKKIGFLFVCHSVASFNVRCFDGSFAGKKTNASPLFYGYIIPYTSRKVNRAGETKNSTRKTDAA